MNNSKANPSQTGDTETASQVFARLLANKKANSQVSVNNDTNPIDTKSSQATSSTNEKLVQLENTLMINKTLNIDPHLFPNGILNKEIVEVFGKFSSGKSEVILHLIARYLLPSMWKINLSDTSSSQSQMNKENDHNSILIDLSEYSCLGTTNVSEMPVKKLVEPRSMPKCFFINNESKSFILRIFTILENRLGSLIEKNAYLNEKLKNVKFVQDKIEKFIKECLRNLIVYQCFNGDQFICALAACESNIQSLMLSKDAVHYQNIIPIFIDTINSNFGIIDRYNSQVGLNENDHTEKYTVIELKKLVDRFNVCVIASRCDHSHTNDVYSYKRWQGILNKRIDLNVITTMKSDDAADNESDGDEKCANERASEQIERVFSISIKSIEISTKATTKQTNNLNKTFVINNRGFNLIN